MTDKEEITLHEFCQQCVIAVRLENYSLQVAQIQLLPKKNMIINS